jgi:hypothetical protein
MKTFAKKLIPGRAAPPEERPIEVTEAKRKWKEAVADRQVDVVIDLTVFEAQAAHTH